LGGVRIRSDRERKRLARLTWTAQTGSPVAEGLYGQDATQATYSRLTDAARAVVAAGHTAIVDAAFLMRAQRRALVELAARIRVPIVLVDVRAPRQLLRSRILSRAEAGTDPSEASLEVLEHQIATADPVLASENLPVIRVDGRKPLDPAALTAISSRLCGR
jgi:predicted kinase